MKAVKTEIQREITQEEIEHLRVLSGGKTPTSDQIEKSHEVLEQLKVPASNEQSQKSSV
jgi:hypothetical protein